MTKMERQANVVQDKIDQAWSAAYKNRPFYKEWYKKLDARWDRLNDFTVTKKFDELTDKQQNAVFNKMDEISNKLNAVAAVLDAFESIMLAIEDFDCANAELVE